MYKENTTLESLLDDNHESASSNHRDPTQPAKTQHDRHQAKLNDRMQHARRDIEAMNGFLRELTEEYNAKCGHAQSSRMALERENERLYKDNMDLERDIVELKEKVLKLKESNCSLTGEIGDLEQECKMRLTAQRSNTKQLQSENAIRARDLEILLEKRNRLERQLRICEHNTENAMRSLHDDVYSARASTVTTRRQSQAEPPRDFIFNED